MKLNGGYSRFLFRSFSLYQFYKYFFCRLIFLTLLGLAIWLFDNNHVAMTIIALIGLAGFLFVGEAELKVYPDKIQYSLNTIIPQRKSRKVFY